MGAELGVITVRSGTPATESPPPVGADIPAPERQNLPEGIQLLLRAADVLLEARLLAPVTRIKLRDLPHGHVFYAEKTNGERVLFSERFGSLLDELNNEIDENQFELVIISAPRRGPLGRFAPMNLPRKLALDLHCSFLVVRGGMPDSRYVVCADGSPSSRRIFPFFKRLLPAVRGPIHLICVQKPDPDPQEVEQAAHCLTRLCDVFGVRFQIIQTAMGWVATPELVAGTANAGAMGFLACAVMRPEEADRAIARVQELTDKPFGVNSLMEQPGAEQIVESIVRRQVKAASYSRSPNAKFITRIKAAGVVCVPTVGAARHAEKAVQLGADVIVAQGGEGGGHTGSVPTSLLLPQVLDAVKVPVAAAGGFHDGRGLAALESAASVSTM